MHTKIIFGKRVKSSAITSIIRNQTFLLDILYYKHLQRLYHPYMALVNQNYIILI
jgi:hypothetical protein